MSPVEVNLSNQEKVWENLYSSVQVQKRRVFSEGDRVRISLGSQTFKKGYTPSWTEELFTVSRVKITNPITYILKDDSGTELKGSFYTEEIQKVGDKQSYRIESILGERGGGSRKEYLVSWFGYPPSFNSWISAQGISRYDD